MLCLARPCSSLGTSFMVIGPSVCVSLPYSRTTLRPGPSSAWDRLVSSLVPGSASPGLSLPMGKLIWLSCLVTRSTAESSARLISAALASSNPMVATRAEAVTATRVKVMIRRARNPVGSQITEG